MRPSTLSYVLVNEAITATDGDHPSGLVTEGRDTFVFTVDLGAVIAAGEATFRIEFINAKGIWQGMHEETLDVDTERVVPIYISPFPTTRIRARIIDYSGLQDGAGDPVSISISLEAI